MIGAGDALEVGRFAVLAGGLGYAAAADLRTREVPDRLWQILGGAGVVFGAVPAAGGGLLPLLLWLVVGAFLLQHLFPWDDALGARGPRLAGPIEGCAYAAVLALVTAAAYRWGLGPTAVPVSVLAVLASVLLARALFELGVLYGGADAKALMVVGVLVPLLASPWLGTLPDTSAVLAVVPFSLTLLTNAALLSVAVPIAIVGRNVARGEFSLARGFTHYTVPVAELPRRFVWVRDPALGQDTLADDAETSAEDAQRRAEVARRLEGQGVRRVWVSPQLPFVVLMAAGALAGILVGNLLLDLIAFL